MKTKEYTIEVVRTSLMKVVLPETMAAEDVIRDWERDLWDLENGADDIAKYAAICGADYPEGSHDGVGKLHTRSWESPDYNKNPYQVVAIVLNEEVDADIVDQEGWNG